MPFRRPLTLDLLYCQTFYQSKQVRGYISKPIIAWMKSRPTIALGNTFCSVVRIYLDLISGIPHAHPFQQVCIISAQNSVFVSGRWNSCRDNENVGIIICMIYPVPSRLTLNWGVYEALCVSHAIQKFILLRYDSHSTGDVALSPLHNLPLFSDRWHVWLSGHHYINRK